MTVFVPDCNIWAFKHKLEFWKSCFSHGELGSFPVLKDQWWYKCELLILYIDPCQHHECLHDSLNQYFPHDQCLILQNHLKCKYTNRCYCKKFIDMVTDTILQLTFEKIPLFELLCNIHGEYLQLSKKAIKVLFPFQYIY